VSTSTAPQAGRELERIRPRHFHRLALAVRDVPAATAWFESVLGSVPISMDHSPAPTDRSAEVAEAFEHSPVTLQWVGGHPLFLMGGEVVAGFLDRNGPGVQSWAWDVVDNWEAEHLVRARGIEVIGVDLAMRLFFMHPKQTHGLLIEWCDGDLTASRPQGPPPGQPSIDGAEIAWLTAVVDDAAEVGDWFASLAEVTPVEGLPAGPEALEQTVDLRVAEMTVRLVTPRAPESRYASSLGGGPRLHSFAVRVPDLDGALATLADQGVATVHRDGDLAATDPEATHGLRIDWTQ
jgi:hypothetical protein